MKKEDWVFLKLDDLTQEYLEDNADFNLFIDKKYEERDLEEEKEMEED